MRSLAARFVLYLLLGLFLTAPVAAGDLLVIGVQYGAPHGFSASWAGGAGITPTPAWGCGAPNDGGNNCVFIPAGSRITGVYGTSTVKQGGIELLVRLVCGMGDGVSYVTVWEGEQFQGTQIVATPPLPSNAYLLGDSWRACWIEWQAVNQGNSTGAGTAFEFQLVLVAQ